MPVFKKYKLVHHLVYRFIVVVVQLFLLFEQNSSAAVVTFLCEKNQGKKQAGYRK